MWWAYLLQKKSWHCLLAYPCVQFWECPRKKKIKVTYSLRPLIHMQNKFNGFSLPFFKKKPTSPTAGDSSLERKGFAKFQRKRRKNLFLFGHHMLNSDIDIARQMLRDSALVVLHIFKTYPCILKHVPCS